MWKDFFPEEEIYFFEEGDPLEAGITTSPLRLRPYQLDALAAVNESVAQGRRRPLVVMATGTGKTPLLVTLPFTRALFLAHRDKLCEQLYQTVRWAKPHLRVGIEKAERSASYYDDVVVASVQTLGANRTDDETGLKELTRRLRKWDQSHFDLIVVDEAHHVLGNSYLRILQHFRAGEPDGPILVGVTATPFRGDGKSIANVFDEVDGEPAYKYLLERATNDGWLCDLLYRRVKTKTDISDVPEEGDDLNKQELSKKVNNDDRHSVIISAIKDHAKDRKTILVFAVDIEHAEAMRQQFINAGLDADVVHYKIPPNEKESILQRFQSGDLRILINVAILTEGVDIATIDCLVFARPTRSMGLFSQMIGRGTRQICPYCASTHFDVVNRLPMQWHCLKCERSWSQESAKNCLVLDLVDLRGQLNIRNAMDLFEERDVDLLGQPIREALPVLRQASALGVVVEDGETIEEVKEKVERVEKLVAKTRYIETEAEAIDLFRSVRATNVPEYSDFPWQKLGKDRYLLFGMNRRQVGLWRNDLGEWYIGMRGLGRQLVSGRSKIPWGKVDKQVKQYFNSTIQVSPNFSVPEWKFVTRHAKWRQKKAGEGQVKELQRHGIKQLPKKLSRGDASDMLSLLKYHATAKAR